MTTADYYRDQHRRRMAKEQKESSDLREVSKCFIGLVIGIAIILAVCILAVPIM